MNSTSPSNWSSRALRPGLLAVADPGMLRRYRRHFAILAFLLLATPLVVGIVKPGQPGRDPQGGAQARAGAPDSLTIPPIWLMLPKADRRLSERPFRLSARYDLRA